MNKILYERNTTALEVKNGFDLQFSYSNCNGNRITARCKTIMDFVDTMESDELDIPMLDDNNVVAVFFENEKHGQKNFDTVEELLEHCKRIVK